MIRHTTRKGGAIGSQSNVKENKYSRPSERKIRCDEDVKSKEAAENGTKPMEEQQQR